MNKYIFLFIIFLYSTFSFSQELKPVCPKTNFTTSDSIIFFSWNKINTTGYTYNLQIADDSIFNNIITNISSISNNFFYIDSFNVNKKYFWRIRAFNGSIYTNWNTTSFFIIYNPSNITSIGLWLDADTGITFESGKVKKWNDLSAKHNNLIQTDSTLQPAWIDSIINNKPCVSFTSALDYLNFTDTIDTLGGSLFSVLKNTNSNGSYFIGYSEYSNGAGLFVDYDFSRFWFKGNRHTDISYNNNTNFLLLSVKQDTAVYGNYWQSYYSKIKINQTISDSISTYGYHMVMNWLGTTNWYGSKKQCDGYLAELIYYYSPLNDSLYNLNEQYLRYKYAPPVNLGYDIHIPYGFCDTTLDAGVRFTNYLWSTGDTTQTITVNQPGQYSVTVTDIFGFESFDSVMVYYPEMNNPVSDTLICFGDTIKWNAGLQDTNYIFLWNTTETDSIISINTANDYYVQITDTFGCTYNSDTAHITIDNYPTTTTLGNDTSLCAGQNLYLQTGANETINYLWNTGDTTNSLQINAAGDYSVTATNTIGCVATDTINIQIHGYAPVPGFDFTNTCFNDLTIFTDTSYTTDGSNIISWQWIFTNSDTSFTQNPTFQFPDTGSYDVSFTILTDSNCSNLITKNLKINPLPSADFSYTNPCSNDSIYFTDNSTINSDTITQWFWNFGNGTSSVLQNNYIIFDTSKTYDISLISITNNGCKDTIEKQIFIKQSPKSNFTVSNACKNSNTIFINQTPNEGIWQIIACYWNFGDDSTSTLENTSHSFATNDTFNVSLTTTLVNGCSNTITKPIIIYDTPISSFITDTVLCVNNYINFIDSSKSDVNIINWKWKFDSLFSSTEQNPIIIFNDTGTYNISLTVETSQGCKNSFSRDITVNSLPIATFNVNSKIGVVPFNVNFTPDDSISAAYWTFGDGYTSNDIFTNHTFSDSGTYTIKLIKINSFGCKDSSETSIKSIIPLIDLGVYDAKYTLKNNSLTTSVNLINLGTLPITKIELFLNIDKGSTVKEVWTGTLNSGQIMHYDFNTIYQLPKYQDTKFVCISANPIFDDYTDNNTNNNEECLSFDNSFNVLNPFPNPAGEIVYFQIITPKADKIELSIYDNIGKIIDVYQVNTSAGYNKFIYNLTNLRKGNYTLKVKYQDIYKSVKFTVN